LSKRYLRSADDSSRVESSVDNLIDIGLLLLDLLLAIILTPVIILQGSVVAFTLLPERRLHVVLGRSKAALVPRLMCLLLQAVALLLISKGKFTLIALMNRPIALMSLVLIRNIRHVLSRDRLGLLLVLKLQK